MGTKNVKTYWLTACHDTDEWAIEKLDKQIKEFLEKNSDSEKAEIISISHSLSSGRSPVKACALITYKV